MDTQSIVALIGISIGLAGSILYAAFRVGSELAGVKATLVPLVGMSERMVRVEVRQDSGERRIESLETNQAAMFERVNDVMH